MSRMKCMKRLSLLSTSGLTALVMLMAMPGASAQKTPDLTVKFPTRINPSHSEMIFRVRMDGLQPATKYYYKVCSEQANGIADPEMSGVNQFTIRSTNWMSASK